MDINTTFKYWLAVARHTSYKIGKQPRPAFVGGKQVPIISTSYPSGS